MKSFESIAKSIIWDGNNKTYHRRHPIEQREIPSFENLSLNQENKADEQEEQTLWSSVLLNVNIPDRIRV